MRRDDPRWVDLLCLIALVLFVLVGARWIADVMTMQAWQPDEVEPRR